MCRSGGLHQFKVDMSKLAAFRYRTEDALRAVTYEAPSRTRGHARREERAARATSPKKEARRKLWTVAR